MLSICPMPHNESAAEESEKTEEYINSLLVYNIPKAVTLSEVIEESQNDRILQEVNFDKYRCAKLVLECLCSWQDSSMNR